jgi:protein-tyrosine-phosphatase
MTDSADRRTYSILFLGTANACRSIMAEAIMGRLGLGRFHAFSAGLAPAREVNPHAVTLLRQLHHDTSDLRPKPQDRFIRDKTPSAPELDFVFTVSDEAAEASDPDWPGQPMIAHWGMPDPALVHSSDAEAGLAFADTYRMLNNRITLLLNLPMSSLDRLTLQKRLEQIGRPA